MTLLTTPRSLSLLTQVPNWESLENTLHSHYNQCREPIPLQYELQSGERSSITIHGVGHIGPLKRCIHAPDIPVSIFSPVHYLHWYPDTAFLYTASMAYILDVENPNQYGEDALSLIQASTVITTFKAIREG